MKKKKNQDRKNRYAKLNRQMKIYIHCRLTARGKEQQEKQRNKCRKNNNRFKKLREKKKKRKMPQNCKRGRRFSQQAFITWNVGTFCWFIHYKHVGKRSEVKSLSHVRLFVTLWTVARLLRPCDSPGKNTGVGCHFLREDTNF